jgi:hypothetical protein
VLPEVPVVPVPEVPEVLVGFVESVVAVVEGLLLVPMELPAVLVPVVPPVVLVLPVVLVPVVLLAVPVPVCARAVMAAATNRLRKSETSFRCIPCSSRRFADPRCKNRTLHESAPRVAPSPPLPAASFVDEKCNLDARNTVRREWKASSGASSAWRQRAAPRRLRPGGQPCREGTAGPKSFVKVSERDPIRRSPGAADQPGAK